MSTAYSVTVTLIVERADADIDPNAADEIADDVAAALSEFEVGMISVFPLPEEPPAPEPELAPIIKFPGAYQN